MRVGIVGIGAMGRGFATNLLGAGFIVQGYDRDSHRLNEFERAGGQPKASPAAATRDADWVLTSLPKHEVVRDAVFGPAGIVEGAKAGLILIDTSTSLPEQAKALGADLAKHNVRFLDASVSGTGATVMSKDVVLLVGGDRADFDACAALFGGFSRRAHHLGPVGSGALGKLVVNVAVVGNRLALAEALTLGMAAGMDPATVLDILKDGSSYSRAMDLKGEKMIRKDYQPESTLGASLHGCSLLLEQARCVGAPMFLTSLYSQIAQVGVNQGYGEADPASVIEVLLKMTDLTQAH